MAVPLTLAAANVRRSSREHTGLLAIILGPQDENHGVP
jgi:hypothetical protein